MRNTLQFLFLLSFVPGSALAANPTIAVMDFSANNASGGDASVLSELVREAVINSGEFTVVDKKNMDKLLQEQAFQRTGCTSEECAVKLGKVLNVQKMIVGSYSMLGNTRFLTARLVDVETGKSERSANVKNFEVGDADTAAKSLVDRLLGREEEPAPRPQPAPQPVYAPAPQTYQQPAYVAPVRTNQKTNGYFMLYAAPVGTASLNNYSRKSNYTWPSGINEDEKTFEIYGEQFGANPAAPALGLRVGGYFDFFAFDVDFAFAKWATNTDPVSAHSINRTYYTETTTRYTLEPADKLLQVSAMNFGLNIYLAYPGTVFQPYVGIGLLMGLMNVSSEYFLGIDGGDLDASDLGLGIQFPVGFRIVANKQFFFWSEYKYLIETLTSGVTVGPSGADSTMDFSVHAGALAFGIGFFFN